MRRVEPLEHAHSLLEIAVVREHVAVGCLVCDAACDELGEPDAGGVLRRVDGAARSRRGPGAATLPVQEQEELELLDGGDRGVEQAPNVCREVRRQDDPCRIAFRRESYNSSVSPSAGTVTPPIAR